MYVCGTCKNESEYPAECCSENMTCGACQGAGCKVCEETELFKE